MCLSLTHSLSLLVTLCAILIVWIIFNNEELYTVNSQDNTLLDTLRTGGGGGNSPENLLVE